MDMKKSGAISDSAPCFYDPKIVSVA
jgi:hypothetical protein